MSSRASPGGSSAFRTRWTRRSLLVTVPSPRTSSPLREHDVRELARPREEDVLDDEVLEPPAAGRALLVRLGLRGVLAEHVDGVELVPLHRVEHAAQVETRLGRDRRPPRRLEAGAGLVVLDERESRQAVRQRAHVPAALDVVLAAQRVEPGAVAADVAGEQREVDEGGDVVDGVVVLGDAELSSRSARGLPSRTRGPPRIAAAGTPVIRSASSRV